MVFSSQPGPDKGYYTIQVCYGRVKGTRVKREYGVVERCLTVFRQLQRLSEGKKERDVRKDIDYGKSTPF